MKEIKLTILMVFAILLYCISIFSNSAINELLLKNNKEGIFFLKQSTEVICTPVQKINNLKIEYLQNFILQYYKSISIINENLFFNKKNNSNKMFCYSINKKTIFKDFFVAILFHNFY